MKIAYYGSSREDVPHDPKVIAANADVMLDIINGLKNKHEIALYASENSHVPGVKIITLGLSAHGLDSAYNKEDWVRNIYTAYILRYLTEIAHDSARYDLVHLHVGKLYMGLPFARVCKCPLVITVHQQLDPKEKEILASFPGAYIISISDSQRQKIPSLKYFDTVYNGTDIDEFKFDPKGSGGFIFRSRISPEKGIEIAIKAAGKTKSKLKIYGPGEKDYLKKSVLSAVNKNIKYLGIVGRGTKSWYESYQKSKALILPIQWEEPFGLVMTEAMACGTPVIAFARGSVPEVIKDGETGFIVNSSGNDKRGRWQIKKTGLEGIIEAIKLLNRMPLEKYQKMRQNCRKHVEDNFSVEKMVEGYEKVYQKAIIDFGRKK